MDRTAPATRRRDRLQGVELVIVDGRNLQGALARESRGTLPTNALIAQVRAALPPSVTTRLILDGHGSPSGRVSPRFEVLFSRARSADDVIAEDVAGRRDAVGPAATWGVLVVTDDRGLRDRVRRMGVDVEGTAWLASLLGRTASGTGRSPGASLGHGRPPRGRRC
jgi:hypothetical protein